ncbi:MAG: shikimate dehydrogenase [Firmicutes bacterium]|nr:shikimate dehydrogenase [Bacillota bacterium]
MNITGRTTLCGLFGFPVEHSFSPMMHNAAFRELGLDWAYLPFAVKPDNLSVAVNSIRALDLAGVNVTVPHKEAVLPYLDELTTAAEMIGAVNVISNNNGKLIGDNTDGQGFTKALQQEPGFTVQGKKAVILGAGGAAKAVAVQLALEGLMEIKVINRTNDRAQDIAQKAGRLGVNHAVCNWEDNLVDIIANSDLVVQATNVGMYPDTEKCLPVSPDAFSPGQVVCDLVYNPVETKFLKMARANGAVTANGLGMLLYQGVLAFEQWTGSDAPVQIMREVLMNQMRGDKQ